MLAIRFGIFLPDYKAGDDVSSALWLSSRGSGNSSRTAEDIQKKPSLTCRILILGLKGFPSFLHVYSSVL